VFFINIPENTPRDYHGKVTASAEKIIEIMCETCEHLKINLNAGIIPKFIFAYHKQRKDYEMR
jgi:hypothetical protein